MVAGTQPLGMRFRTRARFSDVSSAWENQERKVLYEVPERLPADAGLERWTWAITSAAEKEMDVVEEVSGGERGRRSVGGSGGGVADSSESSGLCMVGVGGTVGARSQLGVGQRMVMVLVRKGQKLRLGWRGGGRSISGRCWRD